MSARYDWRSVAILVQSAPGHDPTLGTFASAATPAHSIFDLLSMLVLVITGAIFLVVAGLLIYVLLRYRYRAKRAEPAEEPPQIYGSNQIELSWTVIPVLIIVVLFSRYRTSHLFDRARAKAGRGTGCDGDRASVLVGVSVSKARHCHR